MSELRKLGARMTPSESAIVQALADGPAGTAELAQRIGSTRNSVKVLVRNARRKGAPICGGRPPAGEPRKADGQSIELYRLGEF